MRTTSMLLSAFVITIVANSAQADELAPREGSSIKLGNVVGTAYYTIEKDGYQVVATVASGEVATPVRFMATLLSGQKVILSVPRAVGQSAMELEIKRIEDRVFLNEGGVITSLGD